MEQYASVLCHQSKEHKDTTQENKKCIKTKVSAAGGQYKTNKHMLLIYDNDDKLLS